MLPCPGLSCSGPRMWKFRRSGTPQLPLRQSGVATEATPGAFRLGSLGTPALVFLPGFRPIRSFLTSSINISCHSPCILLNIQPIPSHAPNITPTTVELDYVTSQPAWCDLLDHTSKAAGVSVMLLVGASASRRVGPVDGFRRREKRGSDTIR